MTNQRGPFFSNPFVARAARWGLLAWSGIGVLIVAWGIYRYVLHPIRIVFPPLILALVVVYLLNPLIDRLERRGIRRLLGTIVCYVVLLAAAVSLLAWIVPVITHQVSGFAGGLQPLLRRAQDGLQAMAAHLGVRLQGANLVGAFGPSGVAYRFLGRLWSPTSGVMRLALVVVLGPLLAFYLLVDLPKIRRGATALVPLRRREEVLGLGRKVGDTLGGFFRGQLVVAAMVGAAATLGLWLAGVPYFAVLGALTGLLALVPLIGIVIAAVPVLFVALATEGRSGPLHVPGGWPLALAAVVVLVAAQSLDTRVLSPLFHAPTVRLHPVSVLLSLLVGGALLGFWGMILAVPTVAAGKVVALHLWDTRAQWPPRPTVVCDAGEAQHRSSASG